MSAPDLARLVKDRMATPRDWPEVVDTGPIGRAALRQMYDTERGAPRWRLSGLGKCARALAYIKAGTPPNGRQIDARARLTFSLGDMVEAILVHALREALEDDPTWGLLNVGEDQAEVFLEVPGHEPIKGHPDGIITRDGEPWAVLEIKSIASFGFQRASRELAEGRCPWDPSESYWYQAQAYAAALDLDRVGVLMLCKDSGAVLSFWVHRDPGFLETLRAHLDMASQPPEDVPRVLPDGRELRPRVELSKRDGVTPLKKHGQLPFQCRYCHSFRTCHGPRLTETIGKDYRGAPSLMLYLDRPDLVSL